MRRVYGALLLAMLVVLRLWWLTGGMEVFNLNLLVPFSRRGFSLSLFCNYFL